MQPNNGSELSCGGRLINIFEERKRVIQKAADVTLCAIGRFHHFHLARQMERHGMLRQIVTGYPRRQLRDEEGIPPEKIRTFPWLHAPYMAMGRFGITLPQPVAKEWQWRAQITLDRYLQTQIRDHETLIALSGSGLGAGRRIRSSGGIYICDRGSTHIRYQDQLLSEEYARWDLPYSGIDPRMIEREECEYETANFISVPSSFVADSFVEMGVSRERIFVNPYGARIERFKRCGEPPSDCFTVLFVGQAGIRKGFLYLLQAFQKFKHPNKRLVVVGSVAKEVRPLLGRYNLDNVEFRGLVANAELPKIYSTSHVMVLPSIEEGLAMVIGEAMACGCPVIASKNTGARNFIADGRDGVITEIRNPDAICLALELMAGDDSLRHDMSNSCISSALNIGGWGRYGDGWAHMLKTIEVAR